MSMLAGCSQLSNDGNGTKSGGGSSDEQALEISVGSWTYAEQKILGYMYYEMLKQNTDHSVIDQVNYGNHAEVWKGFQDRKLEVYPDYTGTMWASGTPLEREPVTESMQAQYDALKQELESQFDLQVLEMTSFQNSFGLAAKESWIEQTGVTTISDLAEYINGGNYDLIIAMQKDFYGRSDGWPGLTSHYGIDDGDVEALENNDGVLQTNIGAEAGAVDKGNADVALVYTTDATIERYDLQVITDDQSFWPYYNIIPIVADGVAEESIITQLNKVPAALGEAATMRTLNGKVSIDNEDPQTVAQDFLGNEGLI
jgi:osmoprotectant transport system substrate-binding protein